MFGGQLDYTTASTIVELIRDMFTPHNYEKGEKKPNRSRAAKTRDSWMDFLGAACLTVFNPILPHESGPETFKIKRNLSTAIRTCFFGFEPYLRVADKDCFGNTVVLQIDLPDVHSEIGLYNKCELLITRLFSEIEGDMGRKFKNRRQTEYRYLADLKERHHPSDSPDSTPPSVEDSRRPACPKDSKMKDVEGGSHWLIFAGRKRKTPEQFCAHTSIHIRQAILNHSTDSSQDIEVKVTLSPSKQQPKFRAAGPVMSKRERLSLDRAFSSG